MFDEPEQEPEVYPPYPGAPTPADSGRSPVAPEPARESYEAPSRETGPAEPVQSEGYERSGR